MRKNDGWTIKYRRLAKVYGRQEHEQWIAEKSKNKTKQIRLLEEQKAKLKKQLKEANDLIISVAAMPRFPVNPELCREYLEKWGVK